MTASMTTITNCPSDETLAAFIDGRLEGEARETVLAHVATCSECRDMLNSVHELEAVTPSRRSWLVPAATLAAAAAIAAVVFLGPVGDGFRRTRNLKAVRAATAELRERPMSARPSIDMAFKPVFRGQGETGSPELTIAASELEIAAMGRPTVDNLHAAGIACLLTEEDTRAVDYLERAAKLRTPSAALLNDLAAAYYETRDYEKAKAAIERAWQLEKTPVIAWTRAVILDSDQARRDYLTLDSTSEWANEIRLQIGN